MSTEQENKQRKQPVSKKALVVAGILVVTLGSIFFILKKDDGANDTQTKTATVEKGTIVSTISASGTVVEANFIPLNTSASGIVSKVYAKDGDVVVAGQKIAEVDLDSSGSSAKAQAYSAYLSAKSALSAAEVNSLALKAAVVEAQQKFTDDAVARGLSEDNLTYLQQKSDLVAAENSYNSNGSKISQAKSSLNNAWLNYLEVSSEIVAPESGVLKNLAVVEGLRISGGSSRVATIEKEGKPLLSVDISEIDVPVIKTGQKATITFDSIVDKTFTGVVATVDKIGSTTSGVTSYPALIQIDNDSSQILTSMAGTANIITDSRTDALVVSTSAISTQNGESFVTKITDNDQVSVPVEIGISSDTKTEIVSGVSEGDVIVTGTITASGSTQFGSGSLFGTGFGGEPRLGR